MKFLRQIRLEAALLLRSKFILIMAILVLAASIVLPVVNHLLPDTSSGYPYVVYEGYVENAAVAVDETYNEPTITVGDLTISASHPMYWMLESQLQEIEDAAQNYPGFSSTAAVDIFSELLQKELDFQVSVAKVIDRYEDYRYNLYWNGLTKLREHFFLQHVEDYDTFALSEVANWRMGLDYAAFMDQYVSLSSVERIEKLDAAADYLEKVNRILQNSDFPLYIELSIATQNENIADYEETIREQEALIIANPSREESINEYIQSLRRDIENIKNVNIPMLELRLERNIIPGEQTWQNNAINTIENCSSQLTWTTVITEEEFMQQSWMLQEYKTYDNYVSEMQKQIDDLNAQISVARRSIDTDQPDMRFVPDSARCATVDFLDYSLIVAALAALIGGWYISTEFQTGTVRLLLIRPRTRTKILLSKFFAGLLLCLVVYAAGSLFNFVCNGIFCGFGDYAFPNYTVTGSIGFAAYYLPKLLACMLTILFSYSLAFMLSTVVRNTAISIALPIICYVGALILDMSMYFATPAWIRFLPIPYLFISGFFTGGLDAYLSLPVGLAVLTGCSVIFTVIAAAVFKKRDVTN